MPSLQKSKEGYQYVVTVYRNPRTGNRFRSFSRPPESDPELGVNQIKQQRKTFSWKAPSIHNLGRTANFHFYPGNFIQRSLDYPLNRPIEPETPHPVSISCCVMATSSVSFRNPLLNFDRCFVLCRYPVLLTILEPLC
jgi:hypothetical protein